MLSLVNAFLPLPDLWEREGRVGEGYPIYDAHGDAGASGPR